MSYNLIDEKESSINRALFFVNTISNKFTLEGIMVEWDPFFWMPFNMKFGLNENDWKLIEQRIVAMNIHQTRTMVLPSFHEPINDDDDPFSNNMDGFDFKSNHMKSLKRQLDLCERNGIDVTLSYHGVPSSHWLAYSNIIGWSGPNNLDEYAENVTALLRHLIIDNQYSCIKNLNLFNEPNICYGTLDTDFSVNQWTKGEPEKKEYINMVKTVNERLIKEGLRKRIRLIIVDDSENIDYMHEVALKLADLGDIVSSHNYQFTVQSSKKTLYDWAFNLTENSYKAASKLPHVLYELGNKNIIDPFHVTDAHSFERGFYLPCVVSSYLNMGGTGASYWILFDQLYSDGDRSKAMNMGLFGFKDEDWKLRPTYHAWSLMSRFTKPGAKIFKTTVEDDYLIGVAFENPNGSRTYFAINKQDVSKEISINDPGFKAGIFKKYEYTRESCVSQQIALPPVGDLKMSDNILRDTLKPESFTVYTNFSQYKNI
jgi:alpha-galactosidase